MRCEKRKTMFCPIGIIFSSLAVVWNILVGIAVKAANHRVGAYLKSGFYAVLFFTIVLFATSILNFVLARYTILRKQGDLVLIVERHLSFYKVDETEKVVTVYAVVDGRREYKNLI